MLHSEPAQEHRISRNAASAKGWPAPVQGQPHENKDSEDGTVHYKQEATRHRQNYTPNAISGIGDKR